MPWDDLQETPDKMGCNCGNLGAIAIFLKPFFAGPSSLWSGCPEPQLWINFSGNYGRVGGWWG